MIMDGMVNVNKLIIMVVKVGANSRMTDWRVANPIKALGRIGEVRFKAVCIVTTPPIKKAMKMIMPIDP